MNKALVGEVVIRPMEAEDVDQILDLLKLSLGEGSIPRDLSYWSWKHVLNPFGSSPGLVADQGGSVVGLRVFMRWEWVAGGRRVRAVRAVDTATHPDWRGQKIFSRLTLALVEKMVEEGVSFVFNTPNDSSRPGYLKLGWSRVGRVSIWVRPRPSWRMIRNLAALVRETAKGENQDAPHGLDSMASLLERQEIGSLVDDSNDGDRRLTTRRSATYLRWRYMDIPGFGYGAAWMKRGGDAAALIVRIRQRGEMRELRLCEILVPPRRSAMRVASKLIRETIHASDSDYVTAMAAPGTPERWALVRAGFVPAPRVGPVLTVRPLTHAKGVDPLRRRAWRLSIGELELL